MIEEEILPMAFGLEEESSPLTCNTTPFSHSMHLNVNINTTAIHSNSDANNNNNNNNSNNVNDSIQQLVASMVSSDDAPPGLLGRYALLQQAGLSSTTNSTSSNVIGTSTTVGKNVFVVPTTSSVTIRRRSSLQLGGGDSNSQLIRHGRDNDEDATLSPLSHSSNRKNKNNNNHNTNHHQHHRTDSSSGGSTRRGAHPSMDEDAVAFEAEGSLSGYPLTSFPLIHTDSSNSGHRSKSINDSRSTAAHGSSRGRHGGLLELSLYDAEALSNVSSWQPRANLSSTAVAFHTHHYDPVAEEDAAQHQHQHQQQPRLPPPAYFHAVHSHWGEAGDCCLSPPPPGHMGALSASTNTAYPPASERYEALTAAPTTAAAFNKHIHHDVDAPSYNSSRHGLMFGAAYASPRGSLCSQGNNNTTTNTTNNNKHFFEMASPWMSDAMAGSLRCGSSCCGAKLAASIRDATAATGSQPMSPFMHSVVDNGGFSNSRTSLHVLIALQQIAARSASDSINHNNNSSSSIPFMCEGVELAVSMGSSSSSVLDASVTLWLDAHATSNTEQPHSLSYLCEVYRE